MTHNDSQHLHKIRYRWQKEQQLIRQKYQIPYNMTYTSKQCFNKSSFILSQVESLFKHEKLSATRNNLNTKIYQLDQHHFNITNNDANIPPIHCSKCHLYITKCLCSNGLGQWWINLQKKIHSTDKISKKSLINFIHEQHVNFDSSLIDLSSIEQTKSKSNKQQYVLLDWNNRQSLLNYLRTTNFNKNYLNMTIEQLHELIINNDHIHIFNSIIDLIHSINKQQNQISLCHIYIDPSYYSTIQGTIPLSQSQLIADNINLNRTLYSIEKLAVLLGVKINQSFNEFTQEKISTKQRKTILNQQSLFLTSKIPYNTFRNISVYAQ